jgi:hypothetical protein
MRKPTRSFSAHLALALTLISSITFTTPTFAFTQIGVTTFMGGGIPMGHEWLTRRAAIEVLLATDPKHLNPADPVVPKDPNDPRLAWTSGLAKNLDLSSAGSEVNRIKSMPYSADTTYASIYSLVFAPIIGERWVDIAGFNVTKGKMEEFLGAYNCFDVVAQEPVEVQYDHFMRQYNDIGGSGGVNAATQSQQRFIKYFVAAAMAPPTNILVWDGGGVSTQYTVDRNYFLFGRAAHLFEDSFSLEHTVRVPSDMYTTVHQVKSYLCALGSEQHTHSTPTTFNYSSGDVIWNTGTTFTSGWGSYIPSNMKVNALVAMEATKDLWAAFIRTMAQPLGTARQNQAQQEAQTLVNNWLNMDPNMATWYSTAANRDATYVLNTTDTGSGQSQTQCMTNLNVGTTSQAAYVQTLATNQKICLYNLQVVPGYGDLYDTSLHMPFNWQWINYLQWSQPPASYTIPAYSADTGTRVYLHSIKSGYSMTGKIQANAYVNVNNGANIGFIEVPTNDGTNGYYLRTAVDPTLFLSYTAGSAGQAKLWNGTTQSSYTFPAAGSYSGILNQYYNQYMWVDGNGNVFLTSKGNPSNNNSQWQIKQGAF